LKNDQKYPNNFLLLLTKTTEEIRLFRRIYAHFTRLQNERHYNLNNNNN